MNTWLAIDGEMGLFFVISEHDDIIKWKQFLHHWPLWGEFTGQRWIPLTKASDVELWWFLLSGPEHRLSKHRYVRDLWCHLPDYDVTVMMWSMFYINLLHCCIKCHTILHHIIMTLECILNFALAFKWFNPRYESGGISISNKYYEIIN